MSAMLVAGAMRFRRLFCGCARATDGDEKVCSEPEDVRARELPALLGSRRGAQPSAPEPAKDGTAVVGTPGGAAAPPAADDAGEAAAEAVAGAATEDPAVEGPAADAAAAWVPDPAAIGRMRLLSAREAHARAVATLDAYRARVVRDGPEEAVATLDEFCEVDEEVRRLRYKAGVLRQADAHLRYTAEEDAAEVGACSYEARNAGDPSHYKLGCGADLWVDTCADNTADYRITVPFDIPTDRIMSLFYEIDLYPKWLPFVWESKQLHMVKGGSGEYAQFLVFIRYALPWPLRSREAVLYGFATDRMERGRFQLCAQSVPEGSTEWWGYPIPPARGAVRMDILMNFGFVPQGPELDRTRLDLFLKIDPKIDWLPQGFLNWMGRHFVLLLYRGISSICRSFAKSPYPGRLVADTAGAYSLMYQCLESLRHGRLSEEDLQGVDTVEAGV